MPKEASTYRERLDWAIAKHVFGEPALKRVAGSPQSASNWKSGGVPSHAVVKLLKEQSGGSIATQRDGAQSVQQGATLDTSTTRWPSLRDHDEQRLMFPLMQAILDLYRTKPIDVFEHLIRQTGYLIDSTNVRANKSLALALDTIEAMQRRPKPGGGTSRKKLRPVPSIAVTASGSAAGESP